MNHVEKFILKHYQLMLVDNFETLKKSLCEAFLKEEIESDTLDKLEYIIKDINRSHTLKEFEEKISNSNNITEVNKLIKQLIDSFNTIILIDCNNFNKIYQWILQEIIHINKSELLKVDLLRFKFK